MGKVSDSIGRKKTAISCALIMAMSLAWLIWSQNLWMLYIFGVFFGLANGGLDTSIAALIGDTFGMRSIGVIMGTLQFAWGVGMIIGPAIGGLTFDVSNSYSTAFVIVALTMGVIALLLALTKRGIR